MEKREKLLVLAVAVSIVGTASLYLLSSSTEHRETVLRVEDVLKNPQKYLYKNIAVSGNITGIHRHGNTSTFYLREGNYSMRCLAFGNMSIKEGSALLYGKLRYEERWGIYEFFVERIELKGP